MKKLKKLKKKLEIKIPMSLFKNGFKDSKIKVLQKAAKKVAKDIETHFNSKKDGGWPLSYSQYVADVFYDAFGHHLENYLLKELAKKKGYVIATNEIHNLVIKKEKR